MELKATESMNAYFYTKSAIFCFQANNALQEKSIYIKLRDTTRPRLVFYYTLKKKKKKNSCYSFFKLSKIQKATLYVFKNFNNIKIKIFSG